MLLLYRKMAVLGLRVFAAIILMPVMACLAAESPFEGDTRFEPHNQIDSIFADGLADKHLEPANLCSDAVFLRRVYLDVLGTLPEASEARKFLENPRSDKRSTLINALLKSETFADYWSLKWCDLLRVKAEFPINLWPNAVQAYHRWVYDAIETEMPYDQFARALLTSSGSNFRVPPVNFYRAIQGRSPASIAQAVSLTFMGCRFENWSADQQNGMAIFFSRISYKETAEWKEEIVYLNPEPVGALNAVFPDGTTALIAAGQDPRQVFADWLITADNPWFARAAVNRVWFWLMGRGLIHEPDDIRPGNPAVYPELLAYLEKELVQSGYNLKHICRLILNSSVYQQSSIPSGDPARTEQLFACYPVRQLDAEVLADAICQITGTRESYSSPIPEPFTFIPETNRSIELADGSINSQFLEMFGRPSRDTGLLAERRNEPSAAQRRELLNSSHVQKKIEGSWRLKNWIKTARNNRKVLINTIYLNILSRYPTHVEVDAVESYFKTSKLKSPQAAADLMWALMNSKEFLYRH